MIRSLLTLPLALLFLTSTAFADSDVTATLRGSKSARPGETILLQGVVENRGPDPARDVHVTLDLATYDICADTTFAVLAPGESHRISCEVTLRTTLFPVLDSYLFTLEAALHALVPGTSDLAPNNNAAFQRIELLTNPDLTVFANAFELHAVTPGLPAPLAIFYSNRARTSATNVEVTVIGQGGITKAPDFCTVRLNQATCAVGRLDPSEDPFNPRFGRLDIEFVAPDESAKDFVVGLEIAGAEPDVAPKSNRYDVPGSTYRTFFVTNANDAGSGSLRAAMEASNAECFERNLFCQVAFRIPDATGPQTIRLASPLPVVHGDHLSIDASTQSRYFGAGEIVLDGSALTAGHALELDVPCEAEVRGFSIRDVPGNGIHVGLHRGCTGVGFGTTNIRDNQITGTERGVFVDVTSSGEQTIHGNVVSGNRRSGIFAMQSRGLTITRNVLEHNGASGVYLGPRVFSADVDDNHIGFNAHAGVSIDRDASYVALTGNSFQANGGLAIDRGLDGVTDLSLPVITSARFENGETIIEGTIDSTWARVNVYANDAPDPSGYGEGQYTLGWVETHTGSFTFVHQGDLRGKWIAATATHVQYFGFGVQGATATSTGEFGRAFGVR